jgi:ABC-type transport system involved in multi-copper enzyme maturation permease subunit
MNNIIAVASLVIKEMYRRKDFYVLLILTMLITGLMASVSLFHDDQIIRYIKEVCLLLIWVSMLVIAIGTIARQMPAEFENRTIFTLMAKPLTRSQLIFGKFLGCWLASGLALFVFYLFFACLSFSREHHWHFVNYFQAGVLHWFMLAVLIAFSLFGSLFFATPSSNMTISLVLAGGILLMGRHLNKIALRMEGFGQGFLYSLYYIIPHLEIFDVRDLIIHNWPPIRWGMLSIALLYALFYTAFFLTGACLLFRRKPLH